MTQWGSLDYKHWASSGCDMKIAAGVGYLSLSFCNNLRAKGLFKHFVHFVNLRELDLSFCDLSAIPEEVWELTELEYLHIHKNHICEISPKIKNLTNLKRFDCRLNNLTAFPVEICQLTKLDNFRFNGNKLDVLDPDVVDFITQIKHSEPIEF